MKPPVTNVRRYVWRESGASEAERSIPEEAAIALTYNGGTQAVMMASPQDLEDFAVGFSLNERIVTSVSDILSLDVLSFEDGIELRMWLKQESAERLGERRRHIAGPTGCGLCGIDSIAEAMKPVEQWMRAQENAAQQATDTLLSGSSVWDLIASVVCVGLLTGLGEEMFFRGALQRICCDGMRRRHLAVWTAAFVFSTLHFQFFGFVPRLVLGAFFGYAYLWSGSLWVPVIGHALNNSAVVAFMWMGNNSIDAAAMGEAGSQSAVVAIVSAAVTVAMMVAYKKILANGKKTH